MSWRHVWLGYIHPIPVPYQLTWPASFPLSTLNKYIAHIYTYPGIEWGFSVPQAAGTTSISFSYQLYDRDQGERDMPTVYKAGGGVT